MANLRVNTIRNRSGDNGPIFEGNLSFSSTSHMVLPKGTTGERPVGVSTGSMRYNTDTSLVEYWNGTSWSSVSTFDSSFRGVFGGGSPISTIDYILIAGSGGNSNNFGDLTVPRYGLAACSSSTRGVFGGGIPAVNVIDYITIATSGNAVDFGDLTVARAGLAACSSSTRGIFGGGYTPTIQNVIDYITIASVGNAIDFGDLTEAQRDHRNHRSRCCSRLNRKGRGGDWG